MLEKKSILSTLFAAFKVIFVVFVFSRMYVPILIIVYQSFNASANSRTPLLWGGFTLDNYKAIFTDRQLYVSILDSLLVAFWTTLIAPVSLDFFPFSRVATLYVLSESALPYLI